MAEVTLEARLAELRQRFAGRARARLARLEELATRLAGEAGAEERTAALSEARRLLHELAGGAGTFGFPALGVRAAELEALLKTDPTRLPEALRAALPAMRRELGDGPEDAGHG